MKFILWNCAEGRAVHTVTERGRSFVPLYESRVHATLARKKMGLTRDVMPLAVNDVRGLQEMLDTKGRVRL